MSDNSLQPQESQNKTATGNLSEGIDRRNFLKGGMAVGVGLLLAPMLAKEGLAATPAAPAAASADKPPAKPKLKLADVMKVAREKLYPLCRVCPECDGVACAGEVPGMGGIGSGQGFRNNYTEMAKIQLHMRTFHDVKKPDMKFDLFGHTLDVPFFSAVTGGVTYNMGGKMSNADYINAILGGCLDAGSIGMAADGIGDSLEVYQERLKILKEFGGKGLMSIKPKAQDEIIKRIRLIEDAGGLAFAVDVDSAGRAARALPGQIVEPKTAKQLEELVKCTELPFIIKGIMTVDEARIAVEVGAKGIVVSNHGGRVIDHTPAACTVLPAIADAVKGKTLILVDGAIRHGVDVLKMLALGADAALIGRPLVRGAHGAGREGVALVMNTLKDELEVAMTLTGVKDVRTVSRSVLVDNTYGMPVAENTQFEGTGWLA